MKAIVVLSGGQDSTTCLALAIRDYGHGNVLPVTFDYGQRHSVEVKSAVTVARMAGLAHVHEIITVAGVLKGTSPLVAKSVDVEQYASAEVLPGGLEKTFVPMRNTLFLTLAANRAVVAAMAAGDKLVDMITGVGQEDYGGYPDCRSSFILQLARAFNESLDDKELPAVHIKTPLMDLTKKQTVELSETLTGILTSATGTAVTSARELLAYSHTCYNGAVPPCGKCHACLLRAKGYQEAGVSDPLVQRLVLEHYSGLTDHSNEGKEKNYGRDPVHEDGGDWWFWNETWAEREGPFPDEATARRELRAYADNL